MKPLQMPYRRFWYIGVLAALATQFVAMQLATNVQYFDAPRNLHLVIYTAEQPRFLLNTEDTYDRIHGFLPQGFDIPRSILYPYASDNACATWHAMIRWPSNPKRYRWLAGMLHYSLAGC